MMGFGSKVFALFRARQKAPVDMRDPDGWQPSAGMDFAGDSAIIGTGAVWACVRLLSGTIGSLPLQVYRQGAGGREVAQNHPLYRLLHSSPNFDQTALDFWEFQSASLELWGNAYARIARRDGVVTSLYPVSPRSINVTQDQQGRLRYAWTENGERFERSARDVLHIRGFGSTPKGGMSTLDFCRSTFGLARSVDSAAGATFKNALRPSGVLTFEDWLSKENREIAREELANHVAGADNTGKPVVLEGGAKYAHLTINPDDAQMLESRRFSVEEICRIFGVPPHMVGHTETSTSWGTGLEQQTLAFQKFTLRPRLKRIEQALEKQLLTAADRAAGVCIEFTLEGLLRGDSAARAGFYGAMAAIGAMTINEIRALENLPPVDGGDVPRMQMQNVPITEAGNDDGA